MPDRYTYPGTEVLVNKLGIRDPEELSRVEQGVAEIGLIELRHRPLQGNFDLAHLGRIHRYLMGDLYDWAGQLRTVDTQALGTGVPHCGPDFIPQFARDIFGAIAADNRLRGMDQETFIRRLAHHWGELTALHSFRDGNTRSQSAFIDQLARQAGYGITWQALDLDRLKTARVRAVASSSEDLRVVLAPAIEPLAATDTETAELRNLHAADFPHSPRSGPLLPDRQPRPAGQQERTRTPASAGQPGATPARNDDAPQKDPLPLNPRGACANAQERSQGQNPFPATGRWGS
ncbi:Fic/DOC family protein [Arthrobacter sp. NPDC056727]|uniref:Fic/DOC family protein n=1 Tax=Arthrobacter sp. NPDC056727 TaxID=3345927 RepID=UPI00366D80AD